MLHSISKFSFRCLLVAAVLTAAATSASAQPEHNDTLRTSTWSVYVQGGVSGFHGMRGTDNQYDRDNTYIAPAADFGVMFHPRPWIRFGLDFGYTYLKSADPGVLTNTTETPNVTIKGKTGTLTVNSARIQNRNFTNVAFTDLTLGLNFVEIWRERKDQWFNIWLTAGGGYMHGWNRYNNTFAIDETLVSTGPTYSNLYEHSSVKSNVADNQFDAFYVPVGLSVEFDVIPQLTLAAVGQYKYFPVVKDHTPTGIWTAAAALRYNFVGKKQGFSDRNDKYSALQGDVAEYEKELSRMRQANAELSDANRKLSEEKLRLSSELTEKTTVAVAAVPVETSVAGKLVEVDRPLSNYAVQIMAFRVYQHQPDDKIFHGDNPTIYRNGDLRRYVIFTDTLEAAKAKLNEIRYKYHDAFVVTIDEDGIVRPYNGRYKKQF